MPDGNSHKHWHILVVDDLEENRYLLDTMLKRLGHDVTTASDGRQALDKLGERGIDLIISDILMPVMDGYQLCREVRADKKMCDIPFIFYTASYMDKKDEEFAIKLGADRFLRKPMDSAEFIKHLQELMEEAGKPHRKTRQPEIAEEQGILKLYNERLVKKLEGKMKDLEQEIIRRKFAEQELKAGVEKYRVLVENLNDVIFTVNSDGIITYVSPPIRQLTGYAPEQLIGRPFAGIIPPDDLPMLNGKLQDALENPLEPWDCRYLADGGQIRWARASSRPIFEHGRAVGIQGLFSDVTEHKQLEEAIKESEEQFNALGNSVSEGIWYASVDGRDFQYINPAFEQLYGRSLADIKENPDLWKQIVHPDDRALAEASAHDLLAQGFFESEYRIVRPDGEVRWVFDRKTMVRNRLGEPVRMGGIISDITERKRAEAEILKLNAELEQRVQQRTEQLSEANRNLEAFSYSVSHDLRAPLRGIDGFSRALQEDCADRLDKTGRNHLARIQAGVQRMGRLIDDLLNLSRAGRIPMSCTPVDLSLLAGRVLEELRRSDPGHRVETAIAPGLIALGDESLLFQALHNLLENAWKFTARTEQARIEFGRCRLDGEAVFCVRDNGAGFDMAYADRLFAPFQRLHTQTDFPGIGIGLAIAQRIILRHKGRVWAEAAVGKGAVFYFTLPMEQDNP
jgi:PAS domain S-box-containing protein